MKKYINKGETGIIHVLFIIILITFIFWIFNGGYYKKENKQSPFMKVKIETPTKK
jgi:hypothetical protein